MKMNQSTSMDTYWILEEQQCPNKILGVDVRWTDVTNGQCDPKKMRFGLTSSPSIKITC